MNRCPKCQNLRNESDRRCPCGAIVTIRSIGDVARQITVRGGRAAGRTYQGGELRRNR